MKSQLWSLFLDFQEFNFFLPLLSANFSLFKMSWSFGKQCLEIVLSRSLLIVSLRTKQYKMVPIDRIIIITINTIQLRLLSQIIQYCNSSFTNHWKFHEVFLSVFNMCCWPFLNEIKLSKWINASFSSVAFTVAAIEKSSYNNTAETTRSWRRKQLVERENWKGEFYFCFCTLKIKLNFLFESVVIFSRDNFSHNVFWTFSFNSATNWYTGSDDF